ncbi:MAG: hypothetical protein QOE59_932 [Actinomycetota bacterium]|nr:hypothetical protein [Actinomycetota bacterium]
MIRREMLRAWKLSPTSRLGGFRDETTAASTSNSVHAGCARRSHYGSPN